MDIKQVPIKEVHVLPYATYFVMHFNSLVGVFIPVSQTDGRNHKWINYTGFGTISDTYFNAKELDEYLHKFSQTDNKIYQAYITEFEDKVKFKIINKSEIESLLNQYNTLNAHKIIARRTTATKPAVRKTIRKPPTRKTKRA